MDSDDASNQPRWKGSFSRDAEMRGVDVMGFQECGVGETLTYRPKRCSEQMASEVEIVHPQVRVRYAKTTLGNPARDKSKANCLCHAG